MKNYLAGFRAFLVFVPFFTTSVWGEVVQYHPNSPAYIGGNYDPTYPGRTYPECLQRTIVRSESILPGQVPGTPAATQFGIRKVSSRQELYRILNVSLSISGSYGLFSGDFSGSLEQENTFNEESFTWIVQGYSNFGKFILDSIKLTKDAQALADNPVGFRNRCGTDYVGIEVRAVQAAAVFTIRNLSQSDRKTLEASFSANYGVSGGPLSISGDAKYREFVKTAASYGQIGVNVYAIGGTGVAALSPIITNIDKPDVVLKTIQDYFNSLTLDRSAAVAYNTGSLQSLINRPNIETEIYNKFIADAFIFYEDIGAEQARLNNIYKSKEDWALTAQQADAIAAQISFLADRKADVLNTALNCKQAFTNVSFAAEKRRSICTATPSMFKTLERKFTDLSPKPYYLRYFVSNELIPGEEVINFSIRGRTIKNIQLVKKIDLSTQSAVSINSVQVNPTPDGARQAGTSLLMKDIPDIELPVGIKIETDSGSTYFEVFTFSRASIVNSVLSQQKIELKGLNGLNIGPEATKEDFKKANESGHLLPDAWKEKR